MEESSRFDIKLLKNVLELKREDVNQLEKLMVELLAFSEDTDYVRNNLGSWRFNKEGPWELDVFGFVNGILSTLTGKCLVRKSNADTHEIISWYIDDAFCGFGCEKCVVESFIESIEKE